MKNKNEVNNSSETRRSIAESAVVTLVTTQTTMSVISPQIVLMSTNASESLINSLSSDCIMTPAVQLKNVQLSTTDNANSNNRNISVNNEVNSTEIVSKSHGGNTQKRLSLITSSSLSTIIEPSPINNGILVTEASSSSINTPLINITDDCEINVIFFLINGHIFIIIRITILFNHF